MKRLRAWIVRVAGLLSNSKRERELAEEIEAHLQLHIDDNLRSGLPPDAARREALLKLGGIEPTKEACRDRSTFPLFENILQDFRFSIRQLRKHPGFTATAVSTFALGMCASVSIFGFVDAALLKPLPYRDLSKLVGVYETSEPLCPHCNLSYPDYLDWNNLNTVFSSFAAYQHRGYFLTTANGVQAARGARVTDAFFRTLGVAPVLGRDFHRGEDLPAAPRSVIVSYTAWQNRFGANRNVVGKTVTLDGIPNTIIGVLPRDFHFAPAEPAEFWTTMHASGECDERRSCHDLYGIGRLKNGVTVKTALADLVLIAKQLERQYPGSNHGQGAALVPMAEVIVGNIRPVLLLLLSGAGLLLLIASVNVASLLLVRSEGRRREIAVRRAIGASNQRLVTQFVTEGSVLVLAGGALGISAAYWCMEIMKRLIPADMIAGMPYLNAVGLTARVCFYAALVAALAALLFSLTPTLHLSLSKTQAGLAEGSRGSAGLAWRRLGSKLVIVELAVAMIMLTGAGLLGKSFHNMLEVNLGMQPDHLATLSVAAPLQSYKTDKETVALQSEMLRRLQNLPGVKSVGLVSQLPVSFNGNTDWIRFIGRPFHGEHNEVNQRDASPAYFKTVQATLLRGRYFTDTDDPSHPKVAIINQTFARQYFPGRNPLGQRFGNLDLSPDSMRQIVGVVEDIREGPLDSVTWATEYLPFSQDPGRDFAIVARTAQSERSVVPALIAAVHQINRSIVTSPGATMSEVIHDAPSTYLHRSSAWLVGGFAAVALVLGIVGLYGIVAYSVSQRTREIGVRMALGAERTSVHRLILREAGSLTGIGILIGLLCSLAATSFLRGLLFGVRSWDLSTLLGVAALLGLASVLASYLPARRAASVNPLEALRAE